ncbi:unnamed protein product [Sphagnum balticum]
MREVSASINCCQTGKITGINANGTVTVAINFQKIIRGVIPIEGNPIMGDQIVQYPALVNVPVFVYQGGGAAILMPIAVGDPCLLLFCDRDLDIWFETGQVAPPNSDRVHNINDAIALVGLNNSLSLFPVNNSGVIQIFDTTGERLAQSGMMVAYAGASAPNGWLLCQGQAVSRETYALLFTAIGTTFGNGDGSTTFNLPNMQGQVPVGIGGTLDLTLGQEFGEVNHTLDINEMPAHTHGIAAPSSGPAGSGEAGVSANPGVQSTSTGGGAAHNNVQPSLGVNFIIKI